MSPRPSSWSCPPTTLPPAGNVLRATWERGWSFIKRAGTVILTSSIVLWFLQGYGFVDGVFQAVEDNNDSLLAVIGNAIAWIFYPLGWHGDMAWKAAVATFTGLIAKEEVVNTFGVLYHYAGTVDLMEDSSGIWTAVGADFGAITAYSFMIFNLLCAPCFAAMGAIKREMNNRQMDYGRHRLHVRFCLRGVHDRLPDRRTVHRRGVLRRVHRGGGCRCWWDCSTCCCAEAIRLRVKSTI